MQTQQCHPCSTSGRLNTGAAGCMHNVLHARGQQFVYLRSRQTLHCLGHWLRAEARCNATSGCSRASLGALRLPAWRFGSSKRGNVAAHARSTAGQVGVAAVEEVVEASHLEVLSSFALPSHLQRQRDSYLSLESVESLTSELAEATMDLERLAGSETTSSSAAVPHLSVSDFSRMADCCSILIFVSFTADIRSMRCEVHCCPSLGSHDGEYLKVLHMSSVSCSECESRCEI